MDLQRISCGKILTASGEFEKAVLRSALAIQLLLFCYVFVNAANAQEDGVPVRGIVSDRKTGERLIGATIVVNEKPVAITDKNGYFEFLATAGTHQVRVRMIGYESDEKQVAVRDGDKKISLFFQLEPKVLELSPLSIFGNRFTKETGVQPLVFYKEDLQKVPQFIEADPLRAVQSLPGVVAATSDFNAQVYLRGGNYDETLIALDGVPIFNPYHFAGWLSMVNSDVIGSEKLYLSNYPVEYGGYLSGVLDLISKPGNRENYSGSVSLGIPGVKGYVEGPLWKGSFVLGARRSYFDKFVGILSPDAQLPAYFYDVFGKYQLSPGASDILQVSFYRSRDVFDPFVHSMGTLSVDVVERPNWGNTMLRLSWTHFFGKKTRADVSAYSTSSTLSADGRKFVTSNLGTAQVKSLRIRNLIAENGVRLEGRYSSASHSLLVGLEAKQHRLSYHWNFRWDTYSDNEEILFPKPDSFYDYAANPFDYAAREEIYSAYTSDEILVTDKLTFGLGVRSSYLRSLRKALFLPYTIVEYTLTSEISLRGGYGRYFQPLYTLKENKERNNRFAPFTVLFLADGENKLGFSDHYVVGAEITLPAGITCKVEGYYKGRTNLASSYNDPVNRYKFENGYSTGADILLKKESGRLSGWIGYSFLRAVKDSGSYRYFAHYDRTHTLKILMNWKPSEVWSISAFWTIASGVPYTPVIGKFVSIDYYWDPGYAQGFIPGFYESRPVEGAKNSARTDLYHRLDISVTGSFLWKRVLIKPFLQVFNVYNAPNPYFFEFGQSEQRASMVVPTFGIIVEF